MGLQAVIQNATSAAFNAIGDLSQTLTIRRPSNGQATYDPILGRMVETQEDTDYPCRGVILNLTLKDVGTAFRPAANGATILSGTKKAIIEAASLSIVPMTTDKLIADDGTQYSIEEVKDVKPNATVFTYELQIKLA